MPQAPSFDAVPHHTRECQATPTATEHCKQSSQQPRRDPQTPTGEHMLRLEIGNPHDASRTTGMPPPTGAVAKGRSAMPTNARCLKRRRLQGGYDTRRRRRCSSRSWTGLHPKTSSSRVITPKWRPQQGERRSKAPPPIHRKDSGKCFRLEQ
jgi:hypothetical protein